MASWLFSILSWLASVLVLCFLFGAGARTLQTIVLTDERNQVPEDANIRDHEQHHPYRVRGLPANTKKKTSELLKSTLDEDDLGMRIRSLAPDAYDPHYNVATVIFRKRPKALAPNKSEWRFPVLPQKSSSDEEQVSRYDEIIIDTHFHGFTALSSFQDRTFHLIDIVAICGLGGHAFCSFQERKGDYMWLRDGLPIDLEADGIRVLTYGYDSQLLQNKSFQNIEDIASTFRKALTAVRKADDNIMPRPLVFVAHSLGGIVLKEAMIQMVKSDPATLHSTIQCLLFGVPTQGMNLDTLYPIVQDQHNAVTLLPYLAENSLWLKEQNRKFPDAFHFKDSNIVCFYETKESPTATKVDGKWKMKGDTAVLVSSSSATRGRPWETGTQYSQAVNRNHSDLVKYSRGDQDYIIVLEHLRESSRSAERVIRFRFPELAPIRKSQSASPKEMLARKGFTPVRQLVPSRYVHVRKLLQLLENTF